MERLELSRDLTIQDAGGLLDRVLDAISVSPVVELDCSNARTFDISFLQIVVAAAKAAAERGGAFKIDTPKNENLMAALDAAGMRDSLPEGIE